MRTSHRCISIPVSTNCLWFVDFHLRSLAPHRSRYIAARGGAESERTSTMHTSHRPVQHDRCGAYAHITRHKLPGLWISIRSTSHGVCQPAPIKCPASSKAGGAQLDRDAQIHLQAQHHMGAYQPCHSTCCLRFCGFHPRSTAPHKCTSHACEHVARTLASSALRCNCRHRCILASTYILAMPACTGCLQTSCAAC
jgi:hypothetical protein